MVIPAMDHIDEHLATATLSADYSKAIKAALAIGKATLNWYYNKKDHSEIYRITMGMFSIFNTFNSYLIFNLSFTSSTQAQILSKGWMGGDLGDKSRGNCSYRVFRFIIFFVYKTVGTTTVDSGPVLYLYIT
jgi:hypothetical protein